ncbi:MAG: maltooligosyltrehalose trehalohydrolase [Verrucomicrobiota bacterium]
MTLEPASLRPQSQIYPLKSGLRSQGAEVVNGGVRYRTWTHHRNPEVLIINPEIGTARELPMSGEGRGYFSCFDPKGRAGDLYRYRLNGKDFPDPASRWQPAGVHGPSQVHDPNVYQWSDAGWSRPGFDELIVYELHVGTFTWEGTFRAAIPKLQHLVSLGVTAIELMPIADFPGDRNWGYDGVMLFAPARTYGNPNDLRAFIDAAHGSGLAVILDAVYNHLGPDGNYTGVYHPGYFKAERKTPWGDALNFEEEAVRTLFLENASYWMEEFHFDGFRLDATHAIIDDSQPHILAEITTRVHARGGYVIAEDERNLSMLCASASEEGLGFDGCWADDFHHIVRVMATGEREGHYRNFGGTIEELADTLENGWHYRGQRQRTTGNPRGTECRSLRPEQFIYCISNHDQVGNQAFGERVGRKISPATYRAASALLCLAPYTPLLFMGQEWNASTPFQFFTDHNPELGSKITEGRRREFRDFPAFREPELLETIPGPQKATTFLDSKLDWSESVDHSHAAVLQLYREVLQLRRFHPAFRYRAREHWRVLALEDEIIAIVYGPVDHGQCLILTDLKGGHRLPCLQRDELRAPTGRNWSAVLSTNEERFGGRDDEPFTIPATLVFEAVAGDHNRYAYHRMIPRLQIDKSGL